MNVRILKVATEDLVGAEIIEGKGWKLPSIQDGWRFNFDKLSRTLSNANTYVLVSEKTPEVIEGCLIFQMIDKTIPYMTYVEIAPHNQANPKRYEYVAGCLIAFAFKQSVLKGKGDFKAQLFFDVKEHSKDDEKKLINLYRRKYGALNVGGTKLVIVDENGYKLIDKYLEGK